MTRRRITAALLCVLGLGFVIWGAGIIKASFDTRAWPTTPGTIESATLVESIEPGGEDTLYTARITYRYRAGDRPRTARRISLGDHSSSSRGAKSRLIERYPPGHAVIVYYDPRAPDTALLEPGPVWVTWVPAAFGVLAMALGMAAFRRPKRGTRGSSRG